MEAHNLTQQNANDLEKQLKDMMQENPDLHYRFFEQEGKEPTETEKTLAKIQSDLTELKIKIDLIFGNAVLINGRFQELK